MMSYAVFYNLSLLGVRFGGIPQGVGVR